MWKVALTGGIATGKSYVLGKLRERGVATIDADDIVHAALGPGTLTSQSIAAQFGGDFLKPDGSINRSLLGAKVFGDPASRVMLESLIHPLVYETIRKWWLTLDRPLGVASVPLLFETQRERDFDCIVVTSCSPEQQLQRLAKRDGMTEEEARQRMAAQLSTAEKVRRADYVIDTSGMKQETDRQVDQLLSELSRRV